MLALVDTWLILLVFLRSIIILLLRFSLGTLDVMNDDGLYFMLSI